MVNNYSKTLLNSSDFVNRIKATSNFFLTKLRK